MTTTPAIRPRFRLASFADPASDAATAASEGAPALAARPRRDARLAGGLRADDAVGVRRGDQARRRAAERQELGRAEHRADARRLDVDAVGLPARARHRQLLPRRQRHHAGRLRPASRRPPPTISRRSSTTRTALPYTAYDTGAGRTPVPPFNAAQRPDDRAAVAGPGAQRGVQPPVLQPADHLRTAGQCRRNVLAVDELGQHDRLDQGSRRPVQDSGGAADGHAADQPDQRRQRRLLVQHRLDPGRVAHSRCRTTRRIAAPTAPAPARWRSPGRRTRRR